jgi:hypothetical protein
MARFIENRSTTISKAPGTLTFIGSKKMEHIRLRLISYDENSFFEGEYQTFDELLKNLGNYFYFDRLKKKQF